MKIFYYHFIKIFCIEKLDTHFSILIKELKAILESYFFNQLLYFFYFYEWKI